MEETTKKQAKMELVYLLVDSGYRILIMEGRIYTVSQFTEAGTESDKHVLSGRDVTKALSTFPDFRRLDDKRIDNIIKKIDEAQKVKLHFSSDHRWKLYLP